MKAHCAPGLNGTKHYQKDTPAELLLAIELADLEKWLGSDYQEVLRNEPRANKQVLQFPEPIKLNSILDLFQGQAEPTKLMSWSSYGPMEFFLR